MWCDNCLLVMPLRGGAIAWAVIITAYSLAGSLFLLISGQYLFFLYPEWQVYGGIGLGVVAGAVLTMLALSNKSYVWMRVVSFLWPFLILICAIRAIVMIAQLQRGKDKILWECANSGQLWSETAAAPSSVATALASHTSGASNITTTTTRAGGLPPGFCTVGFEALNRAFVGALLVDLVFQLYMYFLCWRYTNRLLSNLGCTYTKI